MNKKSIEIYDQFFLNTGFTSFDLNFLNLFQATEKTKKNKKSKKIKKLKNLSISFSDEENYSNILKDKKNNEIKEEEQVLTGEINESSTITQTQETTIENNDQTISEKKFDIKKIPTANLTTGIFPDAVNFYPVDIIIDTGNDKLKQKEKIKRIGPQTGGRGYWEV